jgi:polar amino acid transport system substrate-binding protein
MGIAIDICNEFIKREGIAKLNVTLFPFASEIPALNSNRIDLACDTFYVTPERQEQVDFTDTLFFNVETMTTQKGNPKNIHKLEDLDGKIGCSYEGTVWVDWLNELKAAGTNVTIQTYPTPTEEFAAISAGNCDAGLIDAILPGYALQQNPSLNIENVSDYESRDRAANAVSMPLRKDSTDLKDAFNKHLADMKSDGTLAAIFTKWNLTPPEYFINP